VADLTITENLVRAGSNPTYANGGQPMFVGETGGVGAGQAVYSDATVLDANGVGKLKLADADSTPEAANCIGITASPGYLDQPIMVVQGSTDFVPGSALTKAKQYVLSSNPGKIAPVEDMAVGWYYTPLFYGNDPSTTATLTVLPTSVKR
jgi:hypothetical protein